MVAPSRSPAWTRANMNCSLTRSTTNSPLRVPSSASTSICSSTTCGVPFRCRQARHQGRPRLRRPSPARDGAVLLTYYQGLTCPSAKTRVATCGYPQMRGVGFVLAPGPNVSTPALSPEEDCGQRMDSLTPRVRYVRYEWWGGPPGPGVPSGESSSACRNGAGD